MIVVPWLLHCGLSSRLDLFLEIAWQRRGDGGELGAPFFLRIRSESGKSGGSVVGIGPPPNSTALG